MPVSRNRIVVILLILLVALALADILLAARWRSEQPSRQCLPCESLPRQFVAAHPDCATALARSMNITNVRFRPWPGSETDGSPSTAVQAGHRD